MLLRRYGFAILLVLAPVPVQAELPDCSCKDFDKLQQELENAVTLRDRHQAKADEMERRLKGGESESDLKREYSAWETDTAKGAGAGIVATVPSQSAAIGFVPRGQRLIDTISGWSSPVTRDGYTANQYDAAKAHAIEADYARRGQELCDFADPDAIRKAAEQTSFCKGVQDVTAAHEESHRATCKKMGFIAFYFRSPAELARDEVKAYEGQVASLEKAIGKALKGAEIQIEDASKVTYSAQMASFQYSFGVAPIRGKIPDNDGKAWTATLKGVHKTVADKIAIAGMKCTLTSFTREVDISVKAEGRQAGVTFNSFGRVPPIGIKCPGGGGMGGGAGPDAGGQNHTMPLKSSSSYTQDLSSGPLAAALKGTMKVSGTYNSKLTLICPKE